jgi:hypothetical protein
MVCHPSKDWYVKADLQSETESPRLLYRARLEVWRLKDARE